MSHPLTLGTAANGPPSAEPPRASRPPQRPQQPDPAVLTQAAVELAGRLRAAGHEPLSRAELGDATVELAALVQAGIAVRIGRDLYAHGDALADVARVVTAIIQRDGAITLARLRDELGTSRRYAQALLEHLDAARVTLRLGDDHRVLRRAPRSRRQPAPG